MRFLSALVLMLSTVPAFAASVVIFENNVRSEPAQITGVDFTAYGPELLSGAKPICLITGEFMRANNIDGFNLRSAVYSGGWVVECKKVDSVPAGSVAFRMTYPTPE